MVSSGILGPELAIQVLVQFDKSMAEALNNQVKTKVSIKFRVFSRKENEKDASVKGKSCLGTIVHQKTAVALCLTTIKNEDKMEFNRILEAIKANFNDKYDEYRKKWGGGIIGSKSQAKTKAKERVHGGKGENKHRQIHLGGYFWQSRELMSTYILK
ncbi:uncharacterized protein LOC111886698 [Lactuca sativa]|uniref:uncharacterized protein LOC111886698 n=1 Tax=Lactuca sativa TaxID=4236 RepID=UPI0022AF1460|nr:uncharacterized protein LOC111886698 [Lactuca sativa]